MSVEINIPDISNSFFSNQQIILNTFIILKEDIFKYAHDKIVKWVARSNKYEVQLYDRYEDVFHMKNGRHNLNTKGGNIQILRLSEFEHYCSCNN